MGPLMRVGKKLTNLLHYALFVSFFPTLINGEEADKLLR